jgi:ribosomal-protein-alanine N-acetyltransferase
VIGFLRSGVTTLPAIRLDAPRVHLRPPRVKDWRDWAALREESRGFLAPWEPTWPSDALSRTAFVRRLKRQIAEWRRDEAYSFLIFGNADDALYGGIGLSNVRRGVAQMASLGYWMGLRHAGKGYMTEAVGAIVAFAFFQLGLHRIEAACLPSNAASQALLRKAGFAHEGLARGFLRIDGLWQDHLLFAILRDDVG